MIKIDPIRIPVESQLLNFDNYRASFVDVSRTVWQYCGYSGLLTPWHDAIPDPYLPGVIPFLEKTIAKLVKSDVSLYSFGNISLPFHKFDDWVRPSLLFYSTQHLSWTGKLRNYVGSRENLDYLAYFILTYTQICVQYFGKSVIEYGQVIKKDGDKYRYWGYERLWDRIVQVGQLGIDPVFWMQQKIDNFVKMFPKERPNFSFLINMNKLDPDLGMLGRKYGDPWRDIKDFLGLSVDCVIEDGYIPKGWQPSIDDFDDRKKIVSVKGDGHYYYANGTQRRGKWHHVKNTYWGIRCTPENFSEFKDKWLEVSYLTSPPTWEEYSKWAIYPGMWDESGNATNKRGRSTKWKKN